MNNDLVVKTLLASFFTLQIVYASLVLLSSGAERFGWQMFSRTAYVKSLQNSSGMDLRESQKIGRADIHHNELPWECLCKSKTSSPEILLSRLGTTGYEPVLWSCKQ